VPSTPTFAKATVGSPSPRKNSNSSHATISTPIVVNSPDSEQQIEILPDSPLSVGTPTRYSFPKSPQDLPESEEQIQVLAESGQIDRVTSPLGEQDQHKLEINRQQQQQQQQPPHSPYTVVPAVSTPVRASGKLISPRSRSSTSKSKATLSPYVAGTVQISPMPSPTNASPAPRYTHKYIHTRAHTHTPTHTHTHTHAHIHTHRRSEMLAVALYDYAALREQQLNLCVGDQVTIVQQWCDSGVRVV
jgi:hypothetical protein